MLYHPSKGILVAHPRSVLVSFLHSQRGHTELAACRLPRLKAAPQELLEFNKLDQEFTQKVRLTLSWSEGSAVRLSRAAAGCTESCENSELLWAIAKASLKVPVSPQKHLRQ